MNMRRRLQPWRLALFFSLVAFVSVVTADEKPCTAHDGDDYYDLSPLKSREDYEFNAPSGEKFVVNVCKPVSNDTWNVNVDHPEDVGGFTRRDRGDFSIGNANDAVLVRGGHPLLLMTGGSQCPTASGMTASTAIRFICDTSIFSAGKPELVAQLPPDDESGCAFFIEWRTHVACPTHEKGGAWSFLVIIGAILGTAFMLYILVGTYYNRYVLELRGLDQIPRFSLFSFSDVADFCRTWAEHVKDRSQGLRSGTSARWGVGGRNSSGYGGLAEEQDSMMAGPPGWLDEQDEQEHGDVEGTPARAGGMDNDGVIRL